MRSESLVKRAVVFPLIRWFAWCLDSKYPALRDGGRYAILLVDGHSSRMNPDMLEGAANHNILLLCYPPNTTSKLQGMDVGVRGPLKKEAGKKELGMFANGEVLSQEAFIRQVIWPAFQAAFVPANIKAGFRKTGVWPMNDRSHPGL